MELKNMIYFTDAGTINNGKKGLQRTRIAVFNQYNELIQIEYIGDFSNNEGELIAIGRALQIFGVTEIRSDSKIAINWTLRGWTKYNEKSLKKGKLTNRHKLMITKAHNLYTRSKTKLTWIPRDINLAGIYLETHYQI